MAKTKTAKRPKCQNPECEQYSKQAHGYCSSECEEHVLEELDIQATIPEQETPYPESYEPHTFPEQLHVYPPLCSNEPYEGFVSIFEEDNGDDDGQVIALYELVRVVRIKTKVVRDLVEVPNGTE